MLQYSFKKLELAATSPKKFVCFIVAHSILVCHRVHLLRHLEEEIVDVHYFRLLLHNLAWLLTLLWFGWLWLHGGQTLGMRAWKIKLVGDSGQVTLKALVVRFIIATGSLGLGHLWLLFDKKGGALQDRLSHSRLLFHPTK